MSYFHITKPSVLFVLVLACFSLSCKKSKTDPATNGLSAEKNYFLEVALGNEFGTNYNNIRKWQQDVKIYVTDTSISFLNDEVNKVIEEINSLQSGIKLQRVAHKDESNFIIFFGSGTTYASEYEPAAASYISSNDGLFWVYWNNDFVIYKGSMYVDYPRVGIADCDKHLIREELTQALGLMNDSYQYPQSIFYQPWTCTTSYAEVDKTLLQYLYNPAISPGMTKDATIAVLKNL